MAAGTQIVFQVIDLNGVKSTSSIVTVQAGAASQSVSVHSTMSVASVNSIKSIASISSLSVKSTATLTSSAYSSSSTVPTTTRNGMSGGTGGDGDGGKKINTAAIAGGVAGGVAGLVLAVALGFFIARRGGAGHGTRIADSSRAGFHGGGEVQGGQGGQAPMREPALLDIDGGHTPDVGAGTSFGGVNAGSGAGAGAAFQSGAQGGIHGAGVGEVPPTPDVQMRYVTTPPPMQPQLQPQGHNDPMIPVSPQGNQAMRYSGMPDV